MNRTVQLLASMSAALLMAFTVSWVLTENGAQAAFPGRNGKIAFSLDAASPYGDDEIWKVRPNGADMTRLTRNMAEDEHPAWRPDGRRIAFVRWSPGVESPIVVMNPDGSNKKKIPGSQANYGLAWSPDGSKVVFEWGCDIYIMSVDGSRGPQKLTNDPDDCAITPDWSPDGSRIAFTRSGDVYKVAVRSSRVRRLTRTPDYETWPTWSPDGSKIAYTKWLTPAESEAYSAIYKMHADGSDPTPVVDVPGRNAFFPDWQPIRTTTP